MATVSTLARRKIANRGAFQYAESDAAGPTDSVSLDHPVSTVVTHIFVGVQMFDAMVGPTVGSAGTFAIEAKSVNTEQWEEVGTIDADGPETLNFSGNISAVRAVPDSLADVTTWKLIVTGNRH